MTPYAPRGPHGRTPRQVQLLRGMARGLALTEIAAELGISPNTAEGHRERIYSEIGVHTRPRAVAWARAAGLLDEERDGNGREAE